MDIGLGLPVAGPPGAGRADRDRVLAWARAAEDAGFSCLATTDRLVYSTYDSLTVLAAVAMVTERCRVTTAVLVGPLRRNSALLAKQAATVDRLSGGRLVLGLAVGSRRDDFAASEVPMVGRGRLLEEQIAEMRRVWSGERRGIAGPVGPAPVRPEGPEIVLGGHAPAVVARVARLASGWIAGGAGGPETFRAGAAAVTAEWKRAGRHGRPRLLAVAHVALGGSAPDDASRHIRDYYAFAPSHAERVLSGAAVGRERLEEMFAAYGDAGCDELILLPCSTDLRQLDLVSDALAALREPEVPR